MRSMNVVAFAVALASIGGCCHTPKKRDLDTVPLSSVLNAARTQFQATPKYNVEVPGDLAANKCPVSLKVDNYSLTVSVKTTATGEVKSSGSAKGGVAITWSIGPEWDDSGGATTSTAMTWQTNPIEKEKAVHGTWYVTKDHPGTGAWTAVTDSPSPQPWPMANFDDSAASRVVTSITPGTKVTLEQLPTLNDLVQSALHQVVISSHGGRCVYPTGIEFHTGFEVVSMSGIAGTVGLVFFGASHEVTSKMDVVQDLDLKMTFGPGAIDFQ